MATRTLIALIVVLAGGTAGTSLLDGRSGGGSPLEGRVTRVVDGDTVHVDLGGRDEKVRYIGIDTPETHHPSKGVQCFGRAASAYNERLVGGERVRLQTDAERRDRYGRLLAYVTRERDGLAVNAELVRQGYARTLTIPPNVRYARVFSTLAGEARAAGRGLWSSCAPSTEARQTG